VLAKIAEMLGTGSRHRRAAPCCHQSQHASPLAETLVRDARVCPRTARTSVSSNLRTSSRRGNATFGFNDGANLDEGDLWPVAFALKKLTPAEEARIRALVKKAVS